MLFYDNSGSQQNCSAPYARSRVQKKNAGGALWTIIRNFISSGLSRGLLRQGMLRRN